MLSAFTVQANINKFYVTQRAYKDDAVVAFPRVRPRRPHQGWLMGDMEKHGSLQPGNQTIRRGTRHLQVVRTCSQNFRHEKQSSLSCIEGRGNRAS